MSRIKNLTGRVFGRLTVISFSHTDEKQNARWICRCECGMQKIFRGFQLTAGKTNSCGCLHKERASSANRTHGLSTTPEYKAWSSMIERCINPNVPAFKNYGARGIAVCEEWRSFEAFIDDMGSRPSSKHSIERKDNNKNYSKENCYWATRYEQSRNHRRNRWIDTPQGRMLLCDAVEISGIKMVTLRGRLRRGWQVERLFDPVNRCQS